MSSVLQKVLPGNDPFPILDVIRLSLIPAFSPGRRRIVCRVFEKPAAGLAGWSADKMETRKTCSFSPGEKVRMRAS
jgi:hypothetical protein